MTPTQPTPPAPPPGPPPGPPSGPPGPPSAPGAAPTKKGGPTVPLVGFIIVAVLLVVAVVLAIVFFLGKNSESDKKSDAQEQLASTRRERDRLQEQLGGAQSAGETLSDLLTQAASAADDMKACTDAAAELQGATIDVLNARQAGEDVNPRIDALNAQIDQTDSVCSTSDQSYQDLISALTEAQNE
jgi:hypothetical protein